MTATQILTPTPMVKNTAGLNVTTLLATPTSTVLQFANSGREVLAIVAASGTVTVTVDIGATVLGQPVTNAAAVTITNTDIYLFGPFDAPVDVQGTNQVQVTLSATTAVTCALLQYTGAYT